MIFWRLAGLALLLTFAAPLAAAESGASGRLTAAEFRGLLDEVAAGWNNNDPDQAIAPFAENVVYSEPGLRQLFQGRDQLYRFFGGPGGRKKTWWKVAWHHVTFDEAAQVGAVEFSFQWPEGRVHAMASIKLADGKIANWREYAHVSPLDWEAFQGPNRF